MEKAHITEAESEILSALWRRGPLPFVSLIEGVQVRQTWAAATIKTLLSRLMHKDLVEDRRWIGEADYLHALNFCNLLPGPEAQQLATYIGWLMHGIRGALIAGLLFILPGAVAIMALSVAFLPIVKRNCWMG